MVILSGEKCSLNPEVNCGSKNTINGSNLDSGGEIKLKDNENARLVM